MFKNQWLDSNGKRYYLGENGVMCEGWTQVAGNWYYFYPGDGSMAVNDYQHILCRCRRCVAPVRSSGINSRKVR